MGTVHRLDTLQYNHYSNHLLNDQCPLFGGPGSDTLFGRAGDDLLLGQSDNDFLFGSSGSDVLYGGKGNDLLYGGSRIISDRTDDIDSFWFSAGEGTDTVRDLRPGIDLVVLDGGLNLGNTSTRYVQRSTSPNDFGSELVFGNQVLAYFPRVLPEDLNQSLSDFG